MDHPRSRWRTRIAIAVGAALVVLGPWESGVLAADWYPVECRRTSRCAEVDDIAYAPADATQGDARMLTVTTKHGTALVPRWLASRTSMDEAMHACMRIEAEGMLLTCLFLPPEPIGVD